MTEIVAGLKKLLANTYFVYLKTQNFHWNVQGEAFYECHELFESQYSALAKIVDTIAETIRVFGDRAPGSFAEFNELSTIQETPHELASHDMMATLLNDHRTLIKYCEQLAAICQNKSDFATLFVIGEQLKYHKKVVWMFEAWGQ